jgi:multiple sugar transport system substrate-binding protein
VLNSRLLGLLMVFVLLLGIVPLQAQEPVNISIALPGIYEDLLKGAIDDFMAANPDIVVEIVTGETPTYTPGDDIEVYLDEMTEYARAADVLSGQNQFNAISTRAGFFLDLSPLVNADPALNVDEFFTSMWQSYQWDGGIWAIPLGGDVVGLAYDPAEFDEAGLTYPTERWTLDDLILAAEQLAVYGEGDVVEEPPVTNFADAGYIAVAALETPIYDPLQFEGTPEFENPQLETAIELWADLQERGFVAQPEGLEFSALVFAPSVLTAVAGFSGSDVEFQFSTLPGGAVAIQPVGAAISSGSAHPQEAYRLIKFLSQDEGTFTSLAGSPIPARRTMFGAVSDNPLFALELPEALQQVVLDYTERAVPYSQVLFSDYVTQAATNVVSSDISAADALSEMASQAINDLEAATNRRETLTVTVNQNENEVVGTGDITLKFGVVGFGPIPNREEWDAAIADFVTSNSQVATVELTRLSFLTGDTSLTDFHEKVDCFYQPNRLDTSEDLTLLLPIDPLLASDPNLSLDDFVGNTVGLLSQNGVTYGIPLHVQPEVLYYNIDLFTAAGAFMPYQGWTVNDFEQALRTLKFDADDPAAFESQSGGNYTLSLIAAYGAVPLDYRTSPPTVDFTSEANVNAIRQVLDLAKDGYIQYSALGTPGGGPAGLGGSLENPAMYTAVLTDLFGAFGADEEEDNTASYGLVTFPQGVDYSAISYDIGSAYITANSQYPDACYQFISFLSGRPTLFSSMPARLSVINSPELAQAQGDSAIEFYNGLAQQLEQSNVIEFPAQTTLSFARLGDLLSIVWLYRAMDRYVLEDADLLTELEDAEQFTRDYQVCAAQIPAFNDVEETDVVSYVTRFAQCAVDVDETTRSLFVGLNLE